MAPSSNKGLLRASRILRQQCRTDIDALGTALAKSRKIVADSKKLLQRSQELHRSAEHQQLFIIDPEARVHFVAATFLRSVRN